MNGRLARFVAVALLPAAIARADVVYDDTLHPTLDSKGNGYFYRLSHEYGDDINLVPGYRNVSRFTFQYFGDFDPSKVSNPSLTIRFYANDGKLALPTVTSSQMPSTLLWVSPLTALLPGYRIVTLDVPEITVPDRFTWTVQFNGVTGAVGNSAGLILADPVAIGAPLPSTQGTRTGSYWDYWVKSDPNKADSWSVNNFGFGANDPKANFYSRVEAVPEPGTWMLMACGTALLAFAGRRRSTD